MGGEGGRRENTSGVQWHTSVISALGGHRKNDQELKGILNYTVNEYKIFSEKEK